MSDTERDWLEGNDERGRGDHLARDQLSELRDAVVVLATTACVCGGTAACFTCQTADAALRADTNVVGQALPESGEC